MAREDAMVGRNFDDDNDLTNNPASILDNAVVLRAEVDNVVRESETHYYIMYPTYHAYDGRRGNGHGQDSEVIWFVIRKSNQGKMGDLEFVVTNAHGWPQIYAPDKALQERLRENLLPNWKNDIAGWFAKYWINDHAGWHDSGPPQFIENRNGRATHVPGLYLLH